MASRPTDRPFPFWEDEFWRSLRGRPGIVLGNSPAVEMADKALLNRVFTVGVNRILRSYIPSAVLVVDSSVLKVESGSFLRYGGRLICWDGMWRKHQDLLGAMPATCLYIASGGSPKVWRWPRAPGDGLIRVGTTPGYAIQIGVLLGMSPIGLLGVDFNAPDLKRQSLPTHCFGNGSREGATGGGAFTHANAREFYTGAFGWAKGLGSDLVNLSPLDDSPFTRQSGWPRETLAGFVTRVEEAEHEWRAAGVA